MTNCYNKLFLLTTWVSWKAVRCGAACAVVTCLAGCLPEDTYYGLKFSPDGQLVAVVSQKLGLVVADPASQEARQLVSEQIHPAGLSWTTDSLRIAYSSALEGSLDVYLSALDGITTRVTGSPAKETHPMVAGDKLLYLTTESGNPEIALEDMQGSAEIDLRGADLNVTDPVVSPGGQRVAAFGFDRLRPQVYIFDVLSGQFDQVTSETDPLTMVVGPLAWSVDDSAVGFLRNPVQPSEGHDPDSIDIFQDLSVEATGEEFVVARLTPGAEAQEMFSQAGGIRHPRFLKDGSVVFNHGHGIWVCNPDGQKRSLGLDVEAACPEPGGDGGEIAFVAANQLLGTTTASLERARILTFDLEDKFILAEEYFRSGSSGKSYDLYEELASSVQRTRDPEMANFIYIANLRRLGRTDKAIVEIEKLLAEGNTAGAVPEKFLWRLLGFSYLLELNNSARAVESLKRYSELTTESLAADGPDSAHNALEIISETSPAITELYARAVKARLNGNFVETDKLFGELLTTAPHVLAIQREYMNALSGFDQEVYFFSPSQRPFNPSKSQRADYLERLIRTVPDSDLARDARLDLFLLRIEMGSFSRARELLLEALASEPDDGRPHGILEVFYNYLETPEPQPWLNQAIPEVFLHGDIRPLLSSKLTLPEDRLLMAVAATKMALLQNSPDRARAEADGALAEWNRLERNQQTGQLAELYGRLLVLRAREAELRGLYSEAAEEYDQALTTLAEKQADNFEFQEEIRYRAALLRTLVTDYPDKLPLFKEIELRTGTELVNPTWEEEALAAAVRELVQLYDTTSGTLQMIAAYEASVLAGKLRRPHQARAGFAMVARGTAPHFLQRKAILELAALDEYLEDPWNAARWYARIAALPGTTNDVKHWCSFQIARLNLSINYKMSAAREALGLILSTRPGTPLAIQAQELLLSTSTR